MSGPETHHLARYHLPKAHGRRIGLFGGSFNPAHQGHREIALFALKTLQLDAIWWLVALQNPLKTTRDRDDFSERLQSTKIMARHPRFLVSDVEKRLNSRCTADSLKALKPLLNQGKFIWIMGADSFASLHLWQRWREIPQTLPIAVLDRPGFGLKALQSPAARYLAKKRILARNAKHLAETKAPAWVFLRLPLRQESSTAIRKARQS